MVVSAGGRPKDLNLYQAQKALDNAKAAVRPGGILILAAECPEGLGEPAFEDWMLKLSPREQLRRIREDFQLGGHKAAAIALVLQTIRVFLVSSLPPALVEQMGLQPFPRVQDALDAARRQLGERASVTVLPYGGSTLPLLKSPD